LREKKVKINSELIEVAGSSDKQQFAKIIEKRSTTRQRRRHNPLRHRKTRQQAWATRSTLLWIHR